MTLSPQSSRSRALQDPAWRDVSLPGRQRELGQIHEAYREVERNRHPHLVLVSGPMSQGIATLIEAFLRGSRTGPVLRVALDHRANLAQAIARQGSALLSSGRFEAKSREEQPGDFRNLMHEAERLVELTEKTRSVLDTLSHAMPAVVVLRDIRALDRTSLELLVDLVNGPPLLQGRPPALWLGQIDGPVPPAVEPLLAQGWATLVEARPLDREGIAAVLRSPHVIDAALRVTGGMPELIERWIRGELDRSEIESEPLAAAAREALAVLDRPISRDQLNAIVGADSDPELLARIEGAVRRDDERWALGHSERERTLARMPPRQQQRLHARVSEVLSPEDPAEASRHALRAHHVERALELAFEALDALKAAHAQADAAELFLEIEAALPGPNARLLNALADLLWVCGKHRSATQKAREHYSLDPDNAESALRLGQWLGWQGVYDEAEAILTEATKVGSDSDVALEAQVRVADIAICRGQVERARTLSSKAGSAANARRLLSIALDADNVIGRCELAEGDLPAAKSRFASAAAQAEAHGLSRQVCQALNNGAIASMTEGELAVAERALHRMASIAESSGALYYLGIAHKNLAIAKQLGGNFGEALLHAERALPLLSSLGDPSLVARTIFNTADLYVTLGDPYRALRLCNQARTRAHEALRPHIDCEGQRIEASAHAELGDTERAETHWRAALAEALELDQEGAIVEARQGVTAILIDRGQIEAAQREFDATPHPKSRRGQARKAWLGARLAEAEERVGACRQAVAAAEATGDELLEQTARLELCRALLEHDLRDRAAQELQSIEATEERLRRAVPAVLQELFSERSFARRLAATARTLLAAQSRGENAAEPTNSESPIGAEAIGELAYQQLREGEASIYELRRHIERQCVERALRESGGNITKAATVLGMKRPRLSKLVNEWGLKK